MSQCASKPRRPAALLDLTITSADTVPASLGDLTTQLIFPAVVSFLMLGTATVLSIYKPWRRTPWRHSA